MDERDQFHRNEAISAVADEGFMGEEEDDDFDDLYNDVNVGGGFLQSVRKNDEAGSRNEVKEKVKIEEEEAEEVSIPGLVGESVAIKTEPESEVGGSGVIVASSGYGAQELKVSEVSNQIPSGVVGGGIKVELEQAPNRENDVEASRGNNVSQGLLPPPPPPPTLGNNENLMRPVNGATPHGPGIMGNGAAIHMPGVLTGGGGGGGTFLFVGDLHWWTTDAEVEAELCKYGAVKEVRFFDEKASGKSKGYCQVEFYDPMAATACKEGMNGFEFNGRPCVVAFGNPHSIKRMGEAQVNRNQQAQAALAQAKRGGPGPADPPPPINKPVVAPTNNNFNSHAVGGNFQGEENRGFGRGNWGRGNGQGRGPGGQMRNRPGGMGGRGFMGNGGGGFGPMNMMHPQSMGFEQAFGGPMARMGGYGGFPGAPGPPFPGILPSFPPVGGVGLPGVAPHVNPAFFGRGMPMGMMPNAGVDMGMWDPNSGGWGGAAESSYGEEAASEHQYGENHVKEKERASEREWSGSSDRRNREDNDAGYERDMPREKDGGHGYDLPERRHRDDRETGREREREHHHKERERSRDRDRERDRERDRHREERERYGADHRSKHRDEPEHEDEWNRGRSSRGHSKSRLSREDNHRSRSRDADYGKRRRLTTE
ncbi:BnaA03g11280D [Brassica napus]|uniref:BnaA03g11280D protein n=1 Tax=Brassica napus TaxID=3708 RepID=A0A078HIU9_BRANA|nr:BnaA03g11280D [Brassica napus]